MTASAPVAPPRWPADAALLREVPVADLTAEQLADREADAEHRRVERALAARTLRTLRNQGWERTVARDSEGQSGYTWRRAANEVFDLWTNGDLAVVHKRFHMEVEEIRETVDILVARKILPFYLSSAYDEGHADGKASLLFDLRSAAEFGEHEFGDPDDAATDEALRLARDYWLSALAHHSGELERPLDALLDRQPFARRGQIESVVAAVTELLEADRA